MKKLNEFMKLSPQDKIAEIGERGLYLATFHKYGRLFQLYAYGNYFVETIYNVVNRETELICAIGFDSSSFDKYLEQININV